MTDRLILETSAIVSVLLGEDGSPELLTRAAASACVVPASCVVEAVVVLTRRTDVGAVGARNDVEALLSGLGATVAPFDAAALDHALDGFARYGKGRGTEPAALNFGDCLAYGAARAANGRLLFTGADFARTDLA